MEGRGERPHLGVRIEGIADADAFGQRHEALGELGRDPLVKEEPRTGNTGLALIVEDGERRPVDRRRQVGIVEDDVGPLASELELQALQVAGRGFDHLASGGRRPGEGHLGDVWVFGDRGAGRLAEARDDVDHAGRYAHRAHELSQAKAR